MKDKKKLTVMIVLAIAVLGIGAFQFVSSSSPAPAPQVAEKAKEDEKQNPENTQEQSEPKMVAELYKVGMPVRDPFQEGTLPLVEGMTPPPPATNPNPPLPNPVRRPSRPNFSPPPLGGNLRPLPPTGSGLSIAPGSALGNPEEPTYSVSGVITGAKPAAVIVDGSGKQRLVTVGSSLDGDSQLVSVEKGKVVIRHKGKNQTLTVGGTPNAK